MAISFDISPADRALVWEIAARAKKIADSQGIDNFDVFGLTMDITATHAKACPLDLGALLVAEPFDFTHDIMGIWKHFDRKTGEMGGCFRPRFARSTAAAA